ncbi:MAG: four helix bundle protein [Chitinophagaceae bacterium]
MRNFKELKIWQKGFQLAINSYKITAAFPANERFVTSQINRAAVSIPSNIAEGSSRSSAKEYNHYIEISLSSCFELETQLLIAKELNYSNPEILSGVMAHLTEEEKMLTAFRKLLSNV